MGRMSNFIMNLHTTVAGKHKIGDVPEKPVEIYKPKPLSKKGSKKGSKKKSTASLLPC